MPRAPVSPSEAQEKTEDLPPLEDAGGLIQKPATVRVVGAFMVHVSVAVCNAPSPSRAQGHEVSTHSLHCLRRLQS